VRSLSLQTLYSELLQHAAQSSMSPELQRLLRLIRRELGEISEHEQTREVSLSRWHERYAELSQFIEE